MSTRDQLEREERAARALIEADPPQGVAELNAASKALRATGERLKDLRTRVWHEDAFRTAERRGALRERIEQEREKEQERARREPGRKGVRLLVSFADSELRGRSLDAAKLSISEGEELLELVQDRAEGTLSTRRRKRMEHLAGIACGDPEVFERARQERQARERWEAEQAQARSEAQPVRTFTGRGGAYLPALLAEHLFDPDPNTLSVSDLGVLAAILLSLERGEPMFLGSRLEDGRIVLDPGRPYQLLPRLSDGLSASGVQDSIRYLAALGWLSIDGNTIGHGERARKLLEEATAAVQP